MRRTWVWAICGIALLFALDGIGGVAVSVAAALPLGPSLIGLVVAVAVAATGVVLYRSLIMRRWARREPAEILGAGLPALLPGLVVGVGFIGVAFGVVLLAGGYRVTAASGFGLDDLVDVATLVVVSAVIEELLFRGVAFIALERRLGAVPALAITSAFFGAAHLLNPGATLFGALAIAIEAGFLLGACFLWRRTLWFTIGIHAAWNATESLLGIPVSGEQPHGFLAVTPVGGELLTGGAFGIEASIVPMVIGVLLGAGALALRARAGAPRFEPDVVATR